MDPYSRKIIVWTLSKIEILEYIKIAKRIRKTANLVIIQSDYAEKNTIPKFWIRQMKIA